MISQKTPNFIYVDTDSQLTILTEKLKKAEKVALDTEADSLHHYFEKVCLIQLTFNKEHFIVDPLVNLDLSEFLEVLSWKSLIFHGADYDLRMMKNSVGFRPQNGIFDTMLAAQLLGFEQLGLLAIVQHYYGVELSKSGQKSDWAKRPLKPEQLTYAIDDTRFLIPLSEKLTQELQNLGREEWHQESCQNLVKITDHINHKNPDESWRIRGWGSLDKKALVFLREIWKWRDEEAKKGDIPPFKILNNHYLFALADWASQNRENLNFEEIPKLPKNIYGNRLEVLQNVISNATKIPKSEWPEGKIRSAKRTVFGPELNELREECAKTAKELNLNPAVIAPRSALESIILKKPQNLEEIMNAGPLLKWQSKLVEPALKKVLKKETL